ncbi:UPF0182 family protein [Spirulina subsalsa FACHB-351]|uniref:UPF0182 protein K4A83_09935 n=1 Tax=Spirulina subsalsa FACHB-351 TaxID=234711 RepID=A0ABT3L653_9CYAN|nr:UPF0182 family protein [Spirulina subsalsa]MCW6036579.1 UPF0182 family protein [Spirulina subsalsa FACHB-351]
MHTLLKPILLLLGLWLLFELAARALAETLWFSEVQYLEVFWLQVGTQGGLWLFGTGGSAIFLFLNLRQVRKFQHPQPPESAERAQRGKPAPAQQAAYANTAPLSLKEAILLHRQTSAPPPATSPSNRYPSQIKLSHLLPLVLGLNLLLGFLLLHYGETLLTYNLLAPSWSRSTPSVPSPFKVESILHLVGGVEWGTPFFYAEIVVLLGVVCGVLFAANFLLQAIALLLSLYFGFILSTNWSRILAFFNPTPFETKDPLFHLDISFYIFQFPLWKLLYFCLEGLCLYSLIACTLLYLLSGDSLSQGRFIGFSRPQLRHLETLGGLFLLTLAFAHGLACFDLLYSKRGVNYGASYTDTNVQLPLEIALSLLAALVAIWLLYKARFRPSLHSIACPIPGRQTCSIVPLSLVLVFFYGLAVLLGAFASTTVQRLIVQPNELERETPYIERSIAATRAAFALDRIEAETFDPQPTFSPSQLEANRLTIENIRLWDTRPILKANRQLQEIRLYYTFNDADIDRYSMQIRRTDIPSEFREQKQQIVISPRELDYEKVPEAAQTWVNKHLVYTHGYGFTLSPVNRVGEGGLPVYFVQDIATEEEGGTLRLSDEIIQGSIPIGHPRIYYGELTNTYVMTSTQVKELDYPSGQDNVLNVYDGMGGIDIGSRWKRFAFAQYLKDWQMLFTQNFTPETKLLFRRNINERIRRIAPFLNYDHDPYLVNADIGDPKARELGSYLYWIVDAYTTSPYYPYSDPDGEAFNYIRNPVKVVIDAYSGTVNFYVVDLDDPMIKTWQKVFPTLFKSMEEMPPELFNHIRYPTDFFRIQSESLLTYHMTDPTVFYNREDQWQIPKEIYGEEPLPVEPYHLIMRLPQEQSEEFILLHPYTPVARPNLIAWLAARSDGQQYGKLLLYQFPKQRLVFGVSQIEALINQDPRISQQISLWDIQGSNVVKGNLLVIPLEDSLLYVEPLYLEAEQNSVPTLVRVIVVYENTIVMAPTLDQALAGIFNPAELDEEEEAIIRSLESYEEQLLDTVEP